MLSYNYFSFSTQYFVSYSVGNCLAFCSVSFLCTYSSHPQPTVRLSPATGLGVLLGRAPSLGRSSQSSLSWHPSKSRFFFLLFTPLVCRVYILEFPARRVIGGKHFEILYM